MSESFNAKAIILELDNIAEKNGIQFSSNLMTAVEVFADNTHIVSGKGAAKTPLSTTRCISINSSAHKLLNAEPVIRNAAIKLLKIDDILEIDETITA